MPVLCDDSLIQLCHCKGQLIHCLHCTGKSWSVQDGLHHEWWQLLMQLPHLDGPDFPIEREKNYNVAQNYNKYFLITSRYPQLHKCKLKHASYLLAVIFHSLCLQITSHKISTPTLILSLICFL